MPEPTPLLTPPREAVEIIDRLLRSGRQAYLCGGCVRDALLGSAPKDYDIATAATPDEVERLFPKTLPIGKAFGVILVEGTDGGHYEVATFRADHGYADGRRPDSVSFSSAEEDAKRRDFTMNALFYDTSQDRVVDFVDGRADIERRLLRTVGVPAERFGEDHLRLLRAVRFAARTGFKIEEETARAAAEMAGLVKTVSPERIAAELESMLTGGFSRPAFEMLSALNLLAAVLPEIEALKGVEQPPDFHPEGDVWIHTLMLLEENDAAIRGETPMVDFSAIADVNPEKGMHRGDFTGDEYLEGVRETRQALDATGVKIISWSGLLHDIGKPATLTRSDRIRFNDHDRLGAEMASEVLERLRRPRRVVETVYNLIRRHIHFSTLRKMRKSKLRRWLASPDFPLHLELHRLDCLASHRMLANWYFGLQAWREEKALPPPLEPLLRGGDLLAMGIPAGPIIGVLLRQIEDARLEGAIQEPDQARELARHLYAHYQGGTT